MEQDFELKHRLVGAAVLIFFGVLVLPWWLGAPATETADGSVEPAQITDLSNVSTAAPQGEVEPDLLASLMAEQANALDGVEQVLVSRITPLDDNTPADRDQSVGLVGKGNASQDPTAERPTSNAEIARNQAATSAQTSPTVATKADGEKSAKSAVPVTESAEIEVGWAVQVGVFTDQVGAGKVVNDLKAKGFNPKVSTVDTNKGLKTGTRVWLGPYEARVDAAKAKANLTEKTGEPGFIRDFP